MCILGTLTSSGDVELLPARSSGADAVVRASARASAMDMVQKASAASRLALDLALPISAPTVASYRSSRDVGRGMSEASAPSASISQPAALKYYALCAVDFSLSSSS